MKKILSLIIAPVIFLTISCNENPQQFSKREVIERETFVSILVDLHLMDALTDGTRFHNEFHPKDTLDLYSKIFDKYQVTQAEFDSTVANYSRNPDMYLDVYDDVLMELSMRLDEVEGRTEEE